jgi:hypothetical protein
MPMSMSMGCEGDGDVGDVDVEGVDVEGSELGYPRHTTVLDPRSYVLNIPAYSPYR